MKIIHNILGSILLHNYCEDNLFNTEIIKLSERSQIQTTILLINRRENWNQTSRSNWMFGVRHDELVKFVSKLVKSNLILSS